VIHRDLKSPNLMVDRYFRVKVGDFNLSRVAVASVGQGGAGGVGSPVMNSIGGLHSVGRCRLKVS
jgi:serine/threonine protein kinase